MKLIDVTHDAYGFPIILWNVEERNVGISESFWNGNETYHDTLRGMIALRADTDISSKSFRQDGAFSFYLKGTEAVRIVQIEGSHMSFWQTMSTTYPLGVGAEKRREAHPNPPLNYFREWPHYCFMPDTVTRFSMRLASEFELSAMEAASLRSGKLLFLEHYCVIAEFDNGKEQTISRDCTSPQKTRDLVVALNNEIVRNKPEGGWLAKYKRIVAEQKKTKRAQESKQLNLEHRTRTEGKRRQFSVDILGKQLPSFDFNGRRFSNSRAQHFSQDVRDKLRNEGTHQYPKPWTGERLPSFEVVPQPVLNEADIAFELRQEICANFTNIIGWSITSCRLANGDMVDWCDGRRVCFNSDGAHLPNTIDVEKCDEGASWHWVKSLQDLESIEIFDGRTLKLPPMFLLSPEVVQSDDALILCLVFKGGELIPLSYTVKTPRADLEAWKALLVMGWRKQLGLAVDMPVDAPSGSPPITEGHRET